MAGAKRKRVKERGGLANLANSECMRISIQAIFFAAVRQAGHGKSFV